MQDAHQEEDTDVGASWELDRLCDVVAQARQLAGGAACQPLVGAQLLRIAKVGGQQGPLLAATALPWEPDAISWSGLPYACRNDNLQWPQRRAPQPRREGATGWSVGREELTDTSAPEEPLVPYPELPRVAAAECISELNTAPEEAHAVPLGSSEAALSLEKMRPGALAETPEFPRVEVAECLSESTAAPEEEDVGTMGTAGAALVPEKARPGAVVEAPAAEPKEEEGEEGAEEEQEPEAVRAVVEEDDEPSAAQLRPRELRCAIRAWGAEGAGVQLGVGLGDVVRVWTHTETPEGWIYAEDPGDGRAGWLPSCILRREATIMYAAPGEGTDPCRPPCNGEVFREVACEDPEQERELNGPRGEPAAAASCVGVAQAPAGGEDGGAGCTSPAPEEEEAGAEERRHRAARELQAATWGSDLAELARTLDLARAAGVSGSTLAVADQVHRRQSARHAADEELEAAMRGIDARHLQAAIARAHEFEVPVRKVRAAEQKLGELVGNIAASY